jgi:hypothetical protein
MKLYSAAFRPVTNALTQNIIIQKLSKSLLQEEGPSKI